MKVLNEFYINTQRPGLKISVLILLFTLVGCQGEEEPKVWEVKTDVSEEYLTITATITDYHGDFIHMSIRKTNWFNNYSVQRSPADGQSNRDWSQVHQWFRDMNPNTYLEGRIDNGSGEGPPKSTTYIFKLPINEDSPRVNYEDQNGSGYEYITKGYYYADGNPRQPSFSPGFYEIQIYPWYTGPANDIHPASKGKKGVQYIHYEHSLSYANFIIE